MPTRSRGGPIAAEPLAAPPMPAASGVQKVGGVILRDGRLLVVRKKGTSIFIAPGGRREPGEQPLETLRRELLEELGVDLAGARFFGRFSDIAAFENIPITMDVFLVTLSGEPRASAEIEEIRWVSGSAGDPGSGLGTILSNHVIPELRAQGLLPGTITVPRFLVFDLDGTLIFDGKRLDPELEDALSYVVSTGAELAFATARSRRGVKSVLPPWCLEHLVIYCNGAFAERGGQRMAENPLESAVAATLQKRLRQDGAPYVVEMGDSYFHPPGNHPRYVELASEGPGELMLEPPDRAVYKISVLAGTAGERVARASGDLETVRVIAHGDGSYDFLARDCSKWSCLSRSVPAQRLENLVVFGNDWNDHELLLNGALSVVVGDACPYLIGVAHKTVPQATPPAVRRQILEIMA